MSGLQAGVEERENALHALTEIVLSGLSQARRSNVVYTVERVNYASHMVDSPLCIDPEILMQWMVTLPQSIWEYGAKAPRLMTSAIATLLTFVKMQSPANSPSSDKARLEPLVLATFGVLGMEGKGGRCNFRAGPLMKASPDVQVRYSSFFCS
jgi:hypothetical protein